MLEVKIQGGADQGVQVGGRILAAAFVRAGASARAFTTDGSKGRDSSVVAFVRVDECPNNRTAEGAALHHLLMLDPAQLAGLQNALPAGHGTIVVNSPAAPCSWMPGAARVVAVDAADIAGRVGLGPLVASAVVGAFAGATGLLGPDDLVAAVRQGSLDRKAENVAACIMAYRETAAAAGRTEMR